MQPKINEVDQLDTVIGNLIDEYVNGNRTLHHIATLSMKMNERYIVNEELEKIRAQVAAGK